MEPEWAMAIIATIAIFQNELRSLGVFILDCSKKIWWKFFPRYKVPTEEQIDEITKKAKIYSNMFGNTILGASIKEFTINANDDFWIKLAEVIMNDFRLEYPKLDPRMWFSFVMRFWIFFTANHDKFITDNPKVASIHDRINHAEILIAIEIKRIIEREKL